MRLSRSRKNSNPVFATQSAPTTASESQPATETPETPPAQPAAESPQPQAPPPVEIPKPHQDISGSRVSFSVGKDGSPDFSRMQDKARIQLREILSNPRTLKELGVELPQAPPPKPTASDSAPSMGKDESGMMLDILSLINGSIAGRLYKVPPEVTREAFAYDDFHRKKLAPPLERILNKWSPYVLKTYKDEVGFLMLFAGTLNVQVKTMHVLEAQRRSKNPGTAADNVTPISEARKSPEPRTQPEQPRETKTAANMLDSVGIPGIDF